MCPWSSETFVPTEILWRSENFISNSFGQTSNLMSTSFLKGKMSSMFTHCSYILKLLPIFHCSYFETSADFSLLIYFENSPDFSLLVYFDTSPDFSLGNHPEGHSMAFYCFFLGEEINGKFIRRSRFRG